MEILSNIILILVAGIFYRLGGAGNVGDKFDFLRNTKTRDAGVSYIMFLMLLPLGFWGAFFSMGLAWGAMSLGYGGRGEPREDQSDLYKLFGEKVFFAVGFLFGLCIIPVAIHQHLLGNVEIWKPFLARILILVGLIPLIHNYRRRVFGFDEAQVEEFCRGVAIVSTLLIV